MSSDTSRNNIVPLYDLCAEVIQLAQAEREKMTQQEGNIEVQIKCELSQLADSSVLTFTDLVGHLVFKHMQEWGKKECFHYFFFSTEVSVY